jgi:hypothetical protein
MQSRRQSMAETVASVAIGYVVALLSQLAIFPVFGLQVTLTENLLIGAWFTAISIVRGYYVRRFFNWLHR